MRGILHRNRNVVSVTHYMMSTPLHLRYTTLVTQTWERIIRRDKVHKAPGGVERRGGLSTWCVVRLVVVGEVGGLRDLEHWN